MKKFFTICSFLLVLWTTGCEKPPSPEFKIQKARIEVEKMLVGSGGSFTIALFNRILHEPDFDGPLREWGGLATFDGSGNLVNVKTIKLKDFSTGKEFSSRDYTPEELDVSKEQIISFWKTRGQPRELYIMSESLKLGLAEWVLEPKGKGTYGVGPNGGRLQILKINGINPEVLAADLFGVQGLF